MSLLFLEHSCLWKQSAPFGISKRGRRCCHPSVRIQFSACTRRDGLVRVDLTVLPDVHRVCNLDVVSHQVESDAFRLVDTVMDGTEAELSLVLCSDSYIAGLNEQWRNIPRATDVLSFPQSDEIILGDIVISMHTAMRQAAERDHSLQSEVRILLVHGLLHLLGYDHETSDKDMEVMAKAEKKLLAKLGWEGEGLCAASDPSIESIPES